MVDSQQYPLDYASLDKGDVIPAETIEGIIGVRRSSSLYSGGQVDLAHEVEKQLALLDKHVTVACVKTEIKILADKEASVHNKRLFRKGHARLARAHRKLLQVDQSQLSPEDSSRHDRTIIVQSAILAGANAGRRQAIGIVHERKTPGLAALETT